MSEIDEKAFQAAVAELMPAFRDVARSVIAKYESARQQQTCPSCHGTGEYYYEGEAHECFSCKHPTRQQHDTLEVLREVLDKVEKSMEFTLYSGQGLLEDAATKLTTLIQQMEGR